MSKETESKTQKCFLCSTRFRLRDWHVGIERKMNLKCRTIIKVLISDEFKMGFFTPHEQYVIKKRFGFENGKWTENTQTLLELAKTLKVTRERTRQIEERALGRVFQYFISRNRHL